MLDLVREKLENFTQMDDCDYDNLYGEDMAAIYETIYSEMDDWYESQERVVSRYGEGDLLELACGSGILISRLSDFRSMNGLDNSEYMIKIARERLDDDVDLITGDFNNFSFNKKFETIVMLGNPVNHYKMKDLDEMFISIRENLSKGGKLIYDIIPHYSWRQEGKVILEEFEKENFNITRGTYSQNVDKIKSGQYKNRLYMSIRVRDTKNNNCNETSVTSDFYSHIPSQHIDKLKNLGFTVEENRKRMIDDKKTKHLFVAEK